MGGFVNFLKLFKRGMSIYLSSCQLLMPQQLLNALKSGAMIKHGCSKRMAQHVRAAFFKRAHPRKIVRHADSHLRISESAALCRHKQRRLKPRHDFVS